MSSASLKTVERPCQPTMPKKLQRSCPPPNLLDDCTPISRGRRIRTFLHATVVNDRYEQARILIDKLGACVNVKDIYGRTPLMLACLIENVHHGHAFVCLFLSRGAQVNATDLQSRTALHYACLKGDRGRTVTALLSSSAMRCVQERDAYGYTALMYAAMRRPRDLHSSTVVIRSLIHIGYEGSCIDELDELGYTPLLMACRCGNWVAARSILEDGHPETRIRDDELRMTALDWARRAWHTVAHKVNPASCDGTSRILSLQQSLNRVVPAPVPDTVCKMYDSIKPFRCQHPRYPSRASFCVEQVMQGLPEIFQTTSCAGVSTRRSKSQKKNGTGSCRSSSAASEGHCDDVEPDSIDALIACIHLLEMRGLPNEQRLDCSAVRAAPSVRTALLSPVLSTAAQDDSSVVPPFLHSSTSNTPLKDHLLPIVDDVRPSPPTPDLKMIAKSSMTGNKYMVSNLSQLFSFYLPDQFNALPSSLSRLSQQSSRTHSNVDEGSSDPTSRRSSISHRLS